MSDFGKRWYIGKDVAERIFSAIKVAERSLRPVRKNAPKVKTREEVVTHAMQRALERYGVKEQEFNRINRLARKKKNTEVLWIQKEMEHLLVEGIYIVLFCPKLSTAITFLPPDAIWQYVRDENFEIAE